MTMQRKQFGKRGLNQQNTPQWGGQQTSYAAPAYAAPQASYTPSTNDAAFPVGTMITDFLGMFFSFQGRVGRLGYWGYGTFNGFMMIAIAFGYFASLNINFSNAEMAALQLQQASFGTLFLMMLPFMVSNLSLQVRRLHDRDVSGFWMLTWFIPIVGSFIALFQGFANMFFAGTHGPNRFDTDRSQANVFD